MGDPVRQRMRWYEEYTMNQMELMKQRHSVRQFTDKALDAEAVKVLQEEIDDCRKK